MSSFRKTVKCQRPTGAYDGNGRWAESSVSEFTIQASVQPLTPKELESLEEGRRTRDAFKLYSDTALRTLKEQNPDRVVLGGNLFEVVSRADWQNGVIPHYEIVVSLCDKKPDGAA